jgi:hypothetical protein
MNVNSKVSAPVNITSASNSYPGYGAVPPLTYTTTTTNTSGQFLTNGSSGLTWANPNENVMIVKNSPAELEVKGRMVLNGRDLEERLNTIEKVLMIPERDVKLEANYPLLKQKYDDYINTLSKYRMWEELKK